MKKCFFNRISHSFGRAFLCSFLNGLLIITLTSAVSLAHNFQPSIPTQCQNTTTVPAMASLPAAPIVITTSSSSAEIPVPLRKPPSVIPLGCERPFLYQGELYSADPPQAQDASTLKYFVKDVPEANAYLTQYQANREKSRISAFTGVFGLVLLLTSGTLAKTISHDNPDSLHNVLRYSSEALLAGGFLYSFTLLRANEYLVPKAVDAYNHAKPSNPIELKFSTGWTF